METSFKSAGEPGTPSCSKGKQVQKARHLHGLSFFVQYFTPRGRYLRESAFDVPAEDYGAGWLTGYRVLRELLAYEARQRHAHPGAYASVLKSVLAECLRIANEPPARCDMPSRRGAACAVLEVMFELLAATPHAIDIEAFIRERESRTLRLDEQAAARRSEKVAA